jgi:hypothetical protein
MPSGSRAIVSFRRVVVCALAYAAGGAAARAQTPDSLASRGSYWRHFGYGVATSLALHEMAHVMTAEAVGGHPWFGFDKLRPTIYSGINSQLEPHKQFLFSAAGLTIQSLVDEAILDIPHARGSAFERGVLGGGIGTTLFYLTIGRRGSVSDVDFMARTHAMTITQVTLLFGSVAALHTFRISRDRHYANFFARPAPNGRVELGVQLGKP